MFRSLPSIWDECTEFLVWLAEGIAIISFPFVICWLAATLTDHLAMQATANTLPPTTFSAY